MGRLTALGRTISGVAFGANRFFTGHRPQSLSAAVSFGFLIACSISLFQFLLVGLYPKFFSGDFYLAHGLSESSPVLGAIAIWLFMAALGLVLSVVVTQMSLRLFSKASGGWAATWRAVCYAQAIFLVLMFLPWPEGKVVHSWNLYTGMAWAAALFAAAGWMGYVYVVGLARLHNISGGRVVLACFLGFFIAVVLFFIGTSALKLILVK